MVEDWVVTVMQGYVQYTEYALHSFRGYEHCQATVAF
jgi:hypothetical protein